MKEARKGGTWRKKEGKRKGKTRGGSRVEGRTKLNEWNREGGRGNGEERL